MSRDELLKTYRGYIDCLNRRTWDELHRFIDVHVRYNGTEIGLAGYRSMLEGDVRAIPDLHFNTELLVADPPIVASRLRFDCTPTGTLFDLPVNGKRVEFEENVFYEFADQRIASVWSIIDKTAIARQL
jgi:predicted ester cyclase